MLVLLSPSKTMDFTSLNYPIPETKPQFVTEANRLADRLADYSAGDISALMSTSEKIGELTAERFATWKKKYNAKGTKPAIAAYQGDVYSGVQFEQWSSDDHREAQQRLRILSGLYGMLRPSDLIQPYRLEMGTPLPNAAGDDLYAFWRAKLTKATADLLEELGTDVICNLASQEYSKAIDFKRLDVRVITPNFKEEKDGKLRFLTVFGKKARGLMASYLIRERVTDEKGLQRFRVEGYRFNKEVSKPNQPIFTRPQPS